MRRRPLLLVLGIVAAVVAALVSIRILTRPHVESYEIVGHERIAGFATDGRMEQALERFGAPTRREDFGRGHCAVEWGDRGLKMTFVLEGLQQGACAPGAWHASTVVTDPRWTTDRGLKVGDPEARARELYPDLAVDGEGVATLVSREVEGLLLPGLVAQIERGRVASFTVHGPPRAF